MRFGLINRTTASACHESYQTTLTLSKEVSMTFHLDRLDRIISGSIFSVVLILLVLAHATAGAAEDEKKSSPTSMTMNHIMTQAEAEALQPGDSMSMACSKCKTVTTQMVTADKAHVKMMTIGEKSVCSSCGGSVTVVGTGKGTGKNEQVKHVCTNCGDDAMFCTATKPGSGGMGQMKMK